MSHLKPLLLFVLLSPLLHPQAIVQQTNCPKHLTAGTIVAAQAVSTLANYPVIILACYTLDPADFSVTVGAPGTTPVLHTIGGGGGGGGTSATLCVPSSNSATVYTCPSASLGAYANGVNLIFQPDINSGVSPTVNVAGLGPKSLLYNDGTNFSTGGLQSGLSYLFVYDGTFFRVPSNRLVAAGGSCLTTDYSQSPPTVAEQAGCFFGLTSNNAPTGYNDFSGALIRLPESTVGNLPAASSNGGKEFWVTDGTSASDCTTGGGSTFVNFCRAEGSTWVFKGAAPPSGPTDACSSGIGNFKPFGEPTTLNGAGAGIVAGKLYGWEVPANQALCTIDQFSMADSGTGHFELNIWDATGSTILASTTPLLMPGGGVFQRPVLTSAFQLQPNTTYLITFSGDNAGDSFFVNLGALTYYTGMTVPRAFVCTNVATWTGGVMTPPATCGTRLISGAIAPMSLMGYHN